MYRLVTWHQPILKLLLASAYNVETWTSYQIRKIAGCACDGNAGSVFSRHRLQRKPLVSDPSMHHGACVTHVPWCMSGSLTHGAGENVPGIPGACATHNFTYLARGPLLFFQLPKNGMKCYFHRMSVYHKFIMLYANDMLPDGTHI